MQKRDLYNPSGTYEVRTFDVEYRRDGDTPWLARVYQPQGTGPFPALLKIHGGAWTRGDRTSGASADEQLAASGLVVFSVDFRMGPTNPYPSSLIDINYATRWLKAHAAELNADTQILGGYGTSSGGHLATLSAMRPHDPRYAALPLAEAPDVDASLAYIIGAYPILDPYARYLFAKETNRPELVAASEGYWVTEEAMQEGNPTRILERGETAMLPPMLIVQGTEDTNVTPAMQERFVALYRAAGGEVTLELFPGTPHMFMESPSPAQERALQLMKEFIGRQLQAVVTAR